MIDFVSVKSFVIPEGEVQSISKNGVVVWEKQNEIQNPYARELEYIESTGTQYIDTLWNPASTTARIKYKFMPMDIIGTKSICGSYMSVACKYLFKVCGKNSTSNYLCHSVGMFLNTSSGFDITIGEIFEFDCTSNGAKTSVYSLTFDSTKTQTRPNCNITTHTQSLNIFRCNGETDCASMKLHYFQIYEDEVLVRDFIPVMDNNNVPCLFDKVEGKLYYNQGEGEFLYGELVA